MSRFRPVAFATTLFVACIAWAYNTVHYMHSITA